MLPLIHSSKSKVSLVINDTSLLANVFPLCAVAHFGLERIAVVKKIYESFCKKSFQFQIDIIIVVTEFHSTKMQKYFRLCLFAISIFMCVCVCMQMHKLVKKIKSKRITLSESFFSLFLLLFLLNSLFLSHL